MSWIFAISLAAVCFAAVAALFRIPRKSWTLLVAALSVGLAGYGTQASPSLTGAPRSAQAKPAEEGWALVDLRKEFVGEDRRSRANLLITSDAMVRQGQFANAASLLRGVVNENPRDGEAWLALANALTFHSEGALTPASLYAYRKAAQATPDSAGPAFFIGWALIRQGNLIDGYKVWAGQLEQMPEGAPGREALATRLANLEELLVRLEAQMNAQGNTGQ